MLSKEENDLLCRVGPGTLMGEMMRQYWLPLVYSWELEPDGQPQRVRVLGEDLLAWRNTNGRPAFVQESCAHRGVSLYFGRNENSGLRCCYHGWKYDIDGSCIDMPNEPADSIFKTKVGITAYKAAESGGYVWIYMGPAQDHPPELPQFEWCLLPQSHVRHGHKLVYECNWMQALEGELDSTHVYILHSRLREDLSGRYGLWNEDRAARFHIVPTEYGVMYGAERTEEDGNLYWRTTQFLFPFHAMFPAINNGTLPMSIYVPIDDDHTLHMGVSWNPTRPIPQSTPESLFDAPLPEEPGVLGGIGPMKPEQAGAYFAKWWPVVNAESNFHLDLEAKKTKSFTGIPGVRLQDSAVIWSMGKIMPRFREHLGTADASIIRVRRTLLAAVRALAEKGVPPPGARQPELYKVRQCETVLPPSVDWQEALADWHAMRTNDYPNWDQMEKRWNQGRQPNGQRAANEAGRAAAPAISSQP